MDILTHSETERPPSMADRREITLWGSFTWGYSGVGANVYVALGLVMASARGAAPLAFAAAGVVYLLIGLAHTELASTYPGAGGMYYYPLRGLGDFWGFIAGAALLLDYTLHIALFCMASAGYFNFFFPSFQNFRISGGPFGNFNLIWMMETLFLIFFLMFLNIKGARYSSFFSKLMSGVDLIVESVVIVFGFLLIWNPDLALSQVISEAPTLKQFFYAVSIAFISYVGLESISHAAQETRRPATIIPRTSVGLILVVVLLALMLPTLSIGVLPWQTIALQEGAPVTVLAAEIPYIGFLAGGAVAILGATIILISANTVVMGASRLTFSMSKFKVAGSWLNQLHPTLKTPIRSIILLPMIAVVEVLVGFSSGPRPMETMVNLYAFGAILAHLLSLISLVRLRIHDPYTPRPYKMPFNLRVRSKEIPILAVITILFTSVLLALVMWTHPLGRFVGPVWVLLWILYYLWYRKRSGFPLIGNLKR
ncbi:MAG TPA: APC family permease, partial [Candidatus Manganitrophaceae bacterium]|nr:APC family permease [Candidatus Manganitrophaceae bacterium]